MNSALFSKSCLGSVIASDPSLLWFSWSWQKQRNLVQTQIRNNSLLFKFSILASTIQFYLGKWSLCYILAHSGTCIYARHCSLYLKEIMHMPDAQVIIGIFLYILNKTLAIYHSKYRKMALRENKKYNREGFAITKFNRY